MALSDRVLTAALFAEKVVAAVVHMGKQDADVILPGNMVSDALRAAKIPVLGAGYYGAVLHIPGTNNVLKVCACSTDAYPTYALWAQRNPGPGIPAIFWSIRINEDLFLCAMPKYSVLIDVDCARVQSLRAQGEYHEEPASYLGQAVQKVLRALGKFARKDMHDGNFMYCPTTGQYIITDPFASLTKSQDEAEGYATGTQRPKQMREQVVIDFDAPAREAAASVYKEHRKMFAPSLQQIPRMTKPKGRRATGRFIGDFNKIERYALACMRQGMFDPGPINFNKEFLCAPHFQ